LFVGDLLARRNDHLAASEGDKFGDPRRGSDAGIGPGFGVDAQGALPSCFLTNLCERMAHLADDEWTRQIAGRRAPRRRECRIRCPEASRIEGEKSQRVLKEFAERFCFEGNGTDHEVRVELEDSWDGFELPAISESRKMLLPERLRGTSE